MSLEFKMVHSLTLCSPSGRMYDQGLPKCPASPLLLQFESFASAGSRPAITCVAACSASQTAAVDAKGTVFLCDLEQNRYRKVATACSPAQTITGLPLEGGAVAIAVGKETKVYQLNGQLLATLRGHKDRVDRLDVNPLRKWLLSQSVDTLILWEITTWKRIRTLNTEASKYSFCLFTPDCQSLIVNLRDGSLYQLGLGKFSLEKQFRGGGAVSLACCSLQMTEMYGITASNVLIWDMKSPRSPHFALDLPAGVSKVTQAVLIDEGKMALLADNGIVYVIDLKADQTIGELRGDNCTISSFSLAQRRLIYTGSDGLARIVDLRLQLQLFAKRVASHSALLRTTFPLPEALSDPQNANSAVSSSDNSLIVLRKEGVDFNNVSISTKMSDSDPNCQHTLFQGLFKRAGIAPEESKLQHCKLRQLLQHYGEYPGQYRGFIWRFLLQLPNNRAAFEGLYSQGMHPALAALHRTVGDWSAQMYGKVERVVSALAYWSPIFGEAEFVPGLLVSLASVYRGDDLSLFETAIALFQQWFQHWLLFYPTPPLNYLQSVHNLVQFHRPKLHQHLQSLHCAPKAYIWPALRHLYVGFLGLEGTIRLLDFLFTDWDKPQLLLFVAAALVIKQENRLLKMRKAGEIAAFFTSPRSIKLEKILELAFVLFNETPSEVAIVGFDQKLPIPQGQYPLFTGYPKFIVEERQGIREEILAEEEKMAASPASAAEITNQLAEYAEKQQKYQLKREQMTQLEREWRDLAQMEEQIRAQEKLAFDRQTSAQKQQEIQAAEQRFTAEVAKTANSRANELKQLEKELTRGAISDQYGLETKIADEALRAMEQRTLQTIHTAIAARTAEELRRKQDLAQLAYRSQLELKDQVTQAAWEREDEAARLRADLQRAREGETAQRKRLEEVEASVENAQRLKTLEHELKLMEVAQERRLREIAEEELERGQAALSLLDQKRTLLSTEENHHFADLKRREAFHEKKLLQEQQNQLQSITLSHRKDLQSQQDELDRLEREKSRKEAEGRLIELRKQSEQRALQGERQFQQEVLSLDAEAKRKKQENLAKLFEKKEEEEQLYFQRVLQNEKLGLARKSHVEEAAREEQMRKLEEQRARTLRAQEELATAHRARLAQEAEFAQQREVPLFRPAETREKQSSVHSSLSSQPPPEPSRRAVTFHSDFPSPDYTNGLSRDYSERQSNECSCSCESESGASTPPLPTRSVREDQYSEGLSEGSELVLSQSGSSYSSYDSRR